MGTPSEQVAVDPSGGVKQFPKSGVQLEIPPGATQRNVNVNLSVISTPPPAPEGASLLGNAYDIKSEVDVFDEPIRLTIPIPPNQWPSPNELVTVATWDEELRDWVPLGSELDEQQKTVSAWVSHFSKYAAINWNPNKPNIVEMRTTENFTIVALTNTAIVQRVAQLMEEAWDLVVNQLGYRYQAKGKRIWVWITRFTGDWRGFLDEPPATLRKFLFDKNIYLKASLNLSNPSSEGTPAHEFFHFVQAQGYLGKYNYKENEKAASWWAEATAAWIETERAPNHAAEIYRDYSRGTKTGLLKLPLNDPGADDDGREYLAGVFANYLESRFGTEIIRRTWEILSAQVSAGQTANPLKAIENALSERGEKLSDVYFSFALDYAYFRNSPWLSFLPAFKTEEVEVSTSQKTKRFSLPHMSCQFSRLNAQRDKGVLKVEANTDPSIRYAVIDESSKNVVQPGTGSGIQVAGFGANTKSAVLIACNTSLQDKSEFQFSYALEREVFPESPPIPVKPIAIVETSMGTFKIELFADKVPNTVQNFIDLVNRGFYRDMIFHRVVPGFIIQTGDPTGTGRGGSGKTIKLETHPNLKHDGPGVVGMAHARGEDASSQFYITLSEASHLDGNYAVFGRVIEGLDTVMRIGQVRVVEERPIEPVILKSITLEGAIQEPSTLTVCPRGCSFRRIQDAISAAAPGAIIKIGPGTYYENIEITKSLTLQGVSASASERAGIKFEKANLPVIRIAGNSETRVLVKNLTINGMEETVCSSSECWVMLEINGQAQVFLEGIEISSKWSVGLSVEGEANVNITNSLFSGSESRGIEVTDRAKVTLNSVRVSGHGQYGLFVSGRAFLTLMNSEVYDNKNTSGVYGYGVIATGESRLSLVNSQVFGNKQGVQVSLKAQLMLMNSQISNNQSVGVDVGNEAQVEIQSTVIERNGSHGIATVGAVRVTIIDSTIRDNAGWGVTAALKACGGYSDNFTGQVVFRSTTISSNNQSGRHNGRGNPGNHPWNHPNVPDGQVCLPDERAGIQPPTSEGISIGYVNVEALGGMSIDEVRARLKRMSGKKPDLVLQRKDVIMFADHARVTDLTQEVLSGASIAVSASSLRKMAYINAEKVFQGYRRASEAVERFRTEAQKTQNELKALQDRFKRGLISQETFQREATRLQKELQDLDLQLTAEIQGDMLRVIEEIAREIGIDWVTQRKDVVLFANPKVVLDLTELVTRKLNGEQVDLDLSVLRSTQSPVKIGYVHFNQVYQQYRGTEEAVKLFRVEAEKKEQELKVLQEKFKKGWLSEDQFQRESARIQQELQRLSLELTLQTQGEIIKVIEELAKRENYDIALNYEKAILFANEAKITDLTDRVLSEINPEPRANTPAPSQGYSPQITFVDVPPQIPPETPISISIGFTDLDGDVRGVEILDCSFPVFFSNEEPRCLRVLDNDPLQDANVEGLISGTIKITLKCIPFPFIRRRQQIILYDRQGYSSEPFEFTFQCVKQQTSK